MAVGIAIPISIPFIRPEKARRILTSATVLLIICALSLSIPAMGVAVSATATIGAAALGAERAAPAP